MVEVSLTVGKLDASLALLLTKDHHLIEFPTILLPNGVKAGSIVKIKCDQDFETEIEEAKQFQRIQDEILNTFGKNIPQPPHLKVKNITQTSCILEWDKLELGTSSLKNLVLFKDGKKLGSIPQPMTNRTTKLSGLPIDKSFKFQLRLDTTAGIYSSNLIEVTTHKMTDLTGITVCLGDFSPNDQFTRADIEHALKNMRANFPPQDKIKVDTTHFICTRENKQNPEYLKASDMNIPIIRPEWLKACERERRIVGVRDFYVKDCVLPDIFAKNYWNSSGPSKEEQKGVEKESEFKPETKNQDLPALPEVKVENDQETEVTESKGQESEETEPKGQPEELEKKPETVEEIQPVTETKETGEVQLTEEPVTEPVTEDKEVSEPSVESKVEEPIEPVNEPVAEEPVAEEPVDSKDIIEEPVESKDLTEEPVDSKDLTEEPVESKDITEEPVESKDLTEEPKEEAEMLDEIKLESSVDVSAPEPETETKLETKAVVDAEAEAEGEGEGEGETEGGGEGEGEGEGEGDGENEENSPSPSSPSKKKKKNKKKKSKK